MSYVSLLDQLQLFNALKFLILQCTRGSRCKYKHSRTDDDTRTPLSTVSNRSTSLVFCHDFQNTLCSRLNCKFVHGSRQDEDYYKLTGELPKHITDSFSFKGSQEVPAHEGEIPLCKDFLKRECQRGKKCKFLHVSDSRTHQSRVVDDFDIPEAKRRHHEDAEPGNIFTLPSRSFDYSQRIIEGLVSKSSPGQCSLCKSIPTTPSSKSLPLLFHLKNSNQLDLCILHEENLLLRKKIDDLNKQVNDLMATNEFLLDQNAHFRIQGKFSTATSVATVTLPTVTLASSVTVPVTTSVTALGHLGSLSSVQTVQALATLPLVTTQSRSALTASLPFATSVPLTQPTPLATMSIAPVTINQTTALTAQNPTLSAATATVTLTPTINATAIQLPSSALAFSGANGGSLVSYPIMTQSIIAPSELRSTLTHCDTDLYR